MKRLTVLFLLCAAACGGASTDDTGDDVVGPDADPSDRRGTAAIVAGEFESTGIFSTLSSPSLSVSQNAVAGVAGADPVIRRSGGELIIVNRYGNGGDNLVILDAITLGLVDQIGTGAGSNPQDVVQVGDKLYVAALGAPGVIVIDRANDDAITSIDLSTLDDDGLPDCVSVAAVGDRVFVACGLLDNFFADGNGKVAVIDTTDDSVATTIDLPDRNPVGWFAKLGEDLIISLVTYTNTSVGCLAKVTTGDTPTATCLVPNADLDAVVGRVGDGDNCLWLATTKYNVDFSTAGSWLRRLDPDGTVSDKLTADDRLVFDAQQCGSHLFVADKAAGAEGIRSYHVADDGSIEEVTVHPIDIGLPPTFGNGIACQVP